MSRFLDKFNDFSGGRFSFLRLSLVNVLLKSKTLEFNFVCPESEYESVLQSLPQVERCVEQAAATALRVKVKIKKSHFDPHFFSQDIIGFFDFYASLRGSVSKRSLAFEYDKDADTHKVFISLKQIAYQVFESRKLLRSLMDFVSSNYCENINVEMVKLDETEQLEDSDEQAYSFDSAAGRYIQVTQSEGLIGYTIYDLPSYICDAAPTETAVLCGRIKELKEIERKPKDGVHKPNFYKFLLDDTTGAINCVYFPSDKTKGKFASLCDDTQIVAKGKVEYNSFNDTNTLTFYPRSVSFCSLPTEIEINRLKLNVPSSYKNIFPKPYSEFVQTSLFGGTDTGAKKPAESPTAIEFFKNKTFCVFDIETTGLDRLNDKIIEIGAVKITDGVMTQTFSTFIDPQISIPERITRLTGITDRDVKDAPLIEEVLPDFLKFTDGAILVGHNSKSFDFPFLAHAAKKYSVYFDNETMDTYLLARELLTLEQYRLKDLAEYYGVQNEHAHRALDDAACTAKIFMQLAKKLKGENRSVLNDDGAA